MDYLEQCVKSILAQNYDNMEIILVNDCSPDDSGLLCDGLSKSDSRIKVVHKPVNEGLGFARNTGMEYATGDYYYFIDSDDWLEPGSLRPMMENMLQKNLDIIQAKMIVDYEKYIFRSDDSNELKTFSKEDAVDSLFNIREITIVVWDKIYKADIFKKNKFSKTRFNEDSEIMHLLLWESSKTGFWDKSIYHYRQREGSLTTQPISIARANFSIEVCKNRIVFFEEKSKLLFLSAKKKYFTRLIGIYYSLDRSEESSKQFLHEICTNANELLKSICPFLSKKEKIIYTLLGRSLKNSVDGFLLKPLAAFAYKRQKKGQGLKKVPKGSRK